ncbi:hypothetical protein HY409_03950 [Candidatus Gottesmanbacteria bacterium]|nr:hypothetical protein [Candidatus Gottesmanbacteria bacterium]
MHKIRQRTLSWPKQQEKTFGSKGIIVARKENCREYSQEPLAGVDCRRCHPGVDR